MTHGDEILDLLRDGLDEGDPDVTAAVDYLNSSDFEAIHQYMWQSQDVVDVRMLMLAPSCGILQ